jgi:HEAT repeat protein
MLMGNDPGPHVQQVRPAPVWPNRSVAAYIAALRDADRRVRRQAAAALEVLGDPSAVAPFAVCLTEDVAAEVRGNAARALGRLGGSRAVAALHAALHDPDETVYRTAQGALTALGVAEADRVVVRLDEAAVDHLLRALIDADSKVRAYAAYTLRHVAQRDARMREALTAALQDEDAQVRRYAAESLQAGGHG